MAIAHFITQALERSDWHRVREIVGESIEGAPESALAREVIAEASRRIRHIESRRGEITRAQRSALSQEAQPLQDLIDHILFRLYGLTEAESAGLEARLARML